MITCSQCKHYSSANGCNNKALAESFMQVLRPNDLVAFMRPKPSDTCSLAEAKR